MVGEAACVGACVLSWGTRAYLAAKYKIKYQIARENHWAWKLGTPDWVPRIMPWLRFVGWLALLGFILCWSLHPVPLVGFEVSPRANVPLRRVCVH